jgi:hypothetical protein
MDPRWSTIPRVGWLTRGALLAGLLVASGPSDAAEPRWRVAPAGPCAEPVALQACPGGRCGTVGTPVRGRFDPVDVAADQTGGGGGVPPPLEEFSGPGSCADPSTPCGDTDPTEVAGQPPSQPPPPSGGPATPPKGVPSPSAPSPAPPPVSSPPPPGAGPPAGPAPAPPGVVEPPTGPGGLPGLP